LKTIILGMMILIMSVAVYAEVCPICDEEPQSRQCDICRERDILEPISCDPCRERDELEPTKCDPCRERDILEPRKCIACIEPEEKVNPFNCKECDELEPIKCDPCREIEVLSPSKCEGCQFDIVLTNRVVETEEKEIDCPNNECEPISQQGLFGNFAAFFKGLLSK
jgi:hypothetical protein